MNNIRDLKYLIALAEHNHFGKAADACFVSQPTLSMQIKKLEETLGVTLIEREKKNTHLTTAGKLIVEKARKILQECDDIKTIANNTKDPFSGDFNIGIIPTIAPYLLPSILGVLKKKMPALNLIVHEDKTNSILALLKTGSLDAVIIALPVQTDHLKCKTLFIEPFYVALPHSHPLCKEKTISIKTLQPDHILLLSEGHCLREQALEACKLSHSTENTGFRAASLETVRQLVAANYGVTLLPALSVREKDIVTTRPISEPTPSRQIGLLWRKSTAREACCEKITLIIQDITKNIKNITAHKKLRAMKTPLD